MDKNFWDNIEESSGEYVPPKFVFLPEGERVQAAIIVAEWKTIKDYKTNEDDRIISIQIEIESGEFQGRLLFGSLKVYNHDNKRASRDKTILAAIDTNAGGKLRSLGREPTGDDLQKYLVNKSMVFVIGLMETGGKDGKGMNYIQGVSGAGKTNEPARKREVNPMPSKRQLDNDDDIPF